MQNFSTNHFLTFYSIMQQIVNYKLRCFYRLLDITIFGNTCMNVFSIIAVIYLQISNLGMFIVPEFKLDFLHISFCIFPSD